MYQRIIRLAFAGLGRDRHQLTVEILLQDLLDRQLVSTAGCEKLQILPEQLVGAGHLLTNLERAKFAGDETARETCRKYNECDLLIIDDLGTEMPGQFTTAALYSLINDRLLENRPTIISTSLSEDDLARRYNPQIASRLRGSYKRVAFVGDDIRLLKSKGGIR